MSIAKRLLDSTADVAAVVAAKTAQTPPDAEHRSGTRTAPGQMLAARGEVLALQGELNEVREKLKQYDGSIPTIKLDPTRVKPSSLANRHELAYTNAAYASLKISVEQTGGNVQPILVRASADGQYEIVFGHRRHRACLELGLPVLAAVWAGSMSDLDLFVQMDRENREREDLSAFEQGAMYATALEQGLFPSQRRLAESLGVSHTWVRRTIGVAELPTAIVEAFGSPLMIQPIHAEAITAAMETDRKGVLRRAEKLRGGPKKLPPARVVEHLVGQGTEATRPQRIEAHGRPLGSWKRDGSGRVIFTLGPGVLTDEQVQQVTQRIAELASGAVET